jgi:hypothetical protein
MGTVFIISEATNSPSDYLNPGFPATEVMGTLRFGSGDAGQWFLANVVLHSKELTLSGVHLSTKRFSKLLLKVRGEPWHVTVLLLPHNKLPLNACLQLAPLNTHLPVVDRRSSHSGPP